MAFWRQHYRISNTHSSEAWKIWTNNRNAYDFHGTVKDFKNICNCVTSDFYPATEKDELQVWQSCIWWPLSGLSLTGSKGNLPQTLPLHSKKIYSQLQIIIITGWEKQILENIYNACLRWMLWHPVIVSQTNSKSCKEGSLVKFLYDFHSQQLSVAWLSKCVSEQCWKSHGEFDQPRLCSSKCAW